MKTISLIFKQIKFAYKTLINGIPDMMKKHKLEHDHLEIHIECHDSPESCHLLPFVNHDVFHD